MPELASANLAGSALALVWSDGHRTDFDLDWLIDHAPGRESGDPARIPRETWRAELGAAGIPRYEASKIMADDVVLLDWMRNCARLGISIVENVEDSREDGKAVARRIGFLRETNFGVTFEVVNKPKPNNLAYTAAALPLHTDLPNQENTPGYQFLHCLANEAEGGGSIYVDGFAVAEDVAKEAPDDYAMLTTVQVPFRFYDDTCDIRSHRPVIDLWPDGRVKEISHSAHLVDTFDMEPELMTAFYPVFRRWLARLDDPKYAVTLKLRSGQMAVFDNRRILHGRTEFFPNTGFRHLEGYYVDHQEFDSRLRVLARAG